jgi:predicted porin
VGALTAGFGTETTKNTHLGYTDNLGVYNEVIAASTTQSVKNTAMSLAYNAGIANLTYLNAKAALGTGTIKTNTYAISVPLGATTINYSMSSQTSNTGLAGATDEKFSGSQLQAKYALSKRTSAYLQQGAIANKTAGVTTNTKSTQTALGIAHSF